MRFETPLVRGTLIKRYKRFLADVELDSGEVVTASVPNTGSMLGLKEPGLAVWLSVSDSATRKYRHTWELVELAGRRPVHVGINTGHPNRLVEEAITTGTITELAGATAIRREQRYGVNSRIDLLLEAENGALTYVEVKNVHLLRERGIAEFPDSVTERGAKHLGELADMVAAGHRAVMVFLIQRGDCDRMALAGDIDPTYAREFARVAQAGVEALAYACDVSPEAIVVARPVPIICPTG
ncbi:MAG: DNA/RNA nuclease SfsA [Rhizobiales bacterium]|nr:DNA/RNA nuclease SfsA [Hyphomicrobiales bacterium]